jgi:hypothetical protein
MMIRVFVFSLMALTCAACSGGSVTTESPLDHQSKDVNWSVLADRRIFFGHQSVGYNILEGVADVLKERTEPILRIAETAAPGDLRPGVLAHAPVGTNGDPMSKIQAFVARMDAGIAANADVALFKFCYIDVDASTDVAALFDEYKKTMSELAERHPSTTFVHATMPLRTVQGGPKAIVKRLLGRPAGGYLENARRNQYNDLLRGEYSGRGTVFDIAALESQTAEGTPTTYALDGTTLYALNPAYTFDNGHLNAVGRRAVAAGFLTSLARALGERE